MTRADEVQRWLGTLGKDSLVAIDDGGIGLVEFDAAGNPTGAYLEVGGIPEEDEDDEG